MDKPKAHFREEFRIFVETELKTSIDKLNDLRLSRAMTAFYVKRILRSLTPMLVPDDDDDFEMCQTDGTGDRSVDFIYRNEERVVIIQAKYHKRNDTESVAEFQCFRDVLGRLYKVPGSNVPTNSQVQDAVGGGIG